MKLLVSVRSPEETRPALAGGADIIDVKDPSKGSLGAPAPTVVMKVVEEVGRRAEVSAAAGDVRCCPSTVRLASYALASIGVDYVKIGLEVASVNEALELAVNAMEGLSEVGGKAKLVVVAYADFLEVGSVEPLAALEVAAKAGAHVVMIDTRVKDGRTTFSHLTHDYLRRFARRAHELGLAAALAGSLGIQDVAYAAELGYDIVGFRTAACQGGRNGVVSEKRVRALREAVDAATSGSRREG